MGFLFQGAKLEKKTQFREKFLGYQYLILLFAEAELSVWGALPEGVSGEPTEDPVKNGAAFNDC